METDEIPELHARWVVANAEGIVAENLGGHLAAVWAAFSGTLLHLAWDIGLVWCVVAAIAIGVAVYRLATVAYIKKEETAWKAYEAASSRSDS